MTSTVPSDCPICGAIFVRKCCEDVCEVCVRGFNREQQLGHSAIYCPEDFWRSLSDDEVRALISAAVKAARL